MNIGLISDVHATVQPVKEALEILHREKVDVVFCAGDIAGYGTELEQTAALLQERGCISILGNHDAWHLADNPGKPTQKTNAYLASLPEVWDFESDGVCIHGVHASPPGSMDRGIRLLDEHGNILTAEKKYWTRQLQGYRYDVLIVGHTHQYFAEQLGDTLVINPGSTKFNHTCAILNLPNKNISFRSLGGKKPIKSWNWGMMVNKGKKTV